MSRIELVYSQTQEERNTRGKFMELDKTLLKIDHKYQRDKTKKPEKMAKNWSWPSCGALTVNFRESTGQYMVMDGQNRLVAAMLCDNILTLPCMVFRLEGRKEEAKEFSLSNKNRTAVTTLEDFKAMRAAKDPIALRAQELMDEYSIEGFKAVSHLMEFIVKNEPALLRVWPLLVHICKGKGDLMTSYLLAGLWYLESHMKAGCSLTDPPVVKKLNELGLNGLREACDEAKRFYGAGIRKNYARGIFKELNKKRKLVSTTLED